MASPAPDVQRDRGTLFIVAEFRPPVGAADEICALLRETLEDGYYGGEDENVDTAYETALQKANERLHERIAADATNWLSRLHVVVGVLHDAALHLTAVGSMHVFLAHGTRLVDVLDASTGPEREPVNKLKVFTNIVSGDLAEGDRIIVTTPSILDYLSMEKLRRLVHDRAPFEAIRAVEELLTDADPDHSFATLIGGLTSAPAAEEMRSATVTRIPGAPQVSMETLRSQEQKTHDLLTPSVIRSVRSQVDTLWERVRRLAGRRPTAPDAPASQDESAVSLPPPPAVMKPSESSNGMPRPTMEGAAHGLKQAGKAIANATHATVQRLRERRDGLQPIDRLSNALTQSIVRFRRLPLPQKLVLIAAIGLLFLFSQFVVNMGARQEQQKIRSAYDQTLRRLEDTVGSIDAALIYKDYEGARELRAQANDLLASLPDTDPYRQERQRFEQRLRTQYNEVNLISEVANPTQVVDFGQGFETDGTIVSVRRLVRDGDIMYGTNPNTNRLYRFDAASSEKSLEDPGTEDIGSIQVATLGPAGMSLVTAGGNLAEYATTSRTFTKADITLLHENRDIRDIASYTSRLYMLDAANNQVVRYERRGPADYGTGADWITDANLDIHDAVALSVDGSIYVLRGNGELLRLVQGSRDTSFSVAPFEPAMTDATRVVKTTATTRIYLLDPKEKRLVVLAEDGSILQQYRSDRFDNLKDLSIDEAGKVAYLLNGTVVYKIDLPAE
ncbi:MAG: hypothetical protein HY341_01390 [Candidatus Kerfeldbacteria bacterium]|nr:hypothetical protein [Candidatus Kerfeldbacteria bacterium]